MSVPARVPIPWSERLRDARFRFLPLLVFCSALLLLGVLWRNYVAAPTLLGQAELVESNVSSYKPGMLAELAVSRFQKVKAGDTLGQVLVTDPKILASSLAVIQADIEVLRVNLKPIAAQQHNAMDYDHLRLVWMKARADLASAQVNLQLAEAEFHRMDELFKDKIVSQRVFEQAKAARERTQSEVNELTRLVADGEQSFKQLQLTNANNLSTISEDPLKAAIAVQEAKLRLTEAELSPIVLHAPTDGTVNLIYHRAGEAVTAGEPILAIAAPNSVRIVGYLRPPIAHEPRVGSRVQVRTRGVHRDTGSAQVVEVGSQFENIAPALQSQIKMAGLELGLPLSISVPANLKLRPGEVVDLTLVGSGE